MLQEQLESLEREHKTKKRRMHEPEPTRAEEFALPSQPSADAELTERDNRETQPIVAFQEAKSSIFDSENFTLQILSPGHVKIELEPREQPQAAEAPRPPETPRAQSFEFLHSPEIAKQNSALDAQLERVRHAIVSQPSVPLEKPAGSSGEGMRDIVQQFNEDVVRISSVLNRVSGDQLEQLGDSLARLQQSLFHELLTRARQ
jgi:hypothetical protein